MAGEEMTTWSTVIYIYTYRGMVIPWVQSWNVETSAIPVQELERKSILSHSHRKKKKKKTRESNKLWLLLDMNRAAWQRNKTRIKNWMVFENDDDRLIQPQMKYWTLGRANHKSASLTDDLQYYGRNGGEKDMKIERRNSAGGRRFLLFTQDLDSTVRLSVSPNNRKHTQHSTQHWLTSKRVLV